MGGQWPARISDPSFRRNCGLGVPGTAGRCYHCSQAPNPLGAVLRGDTSEDSPDPQPHFPRAVSLTGFKRLD